MDKHIVELYNQALKDYDEAIQKLERIRETCRCSRDNTNCAKCPMCDECEELCTDETNLQDIILRIIDEEV